MALNLKTYQRFNGVLHETVITNICRTFNQLYFYKKNFVVLSEELVRVCFLLASVCMSSNEELRIFFSFENAIRGHPDLDIFDSFEWYFWR